MAWQDWLKKNGYEDIVNTKTTNSSPVSQSSSNTSNWQNWLKNYEAEKTKTTSSSKLNANDIFVDAPTTPKYAAAPTSPVTKAMTDMLFTPKIPTIKNPNSVIPNGTLNIEEKYPITPSSPVTKALNDMVFTPKIPKIEIPQAITHTVDKNKLSMDKALSVEKNVHSFQDDMRNNAWAGTYLGIPAAVAKGVQMVAKPLNDLSGTILRSLGITPDNKVYNAVDSTQKYLGDKFDEKSAELDKNASAGKQLINSTIRALPNILATGEAGAALKIAKMPEEAGKAAKLVNEVKGLVPFMSTAFGNYARDEEKKGGSYGKQLAYGAVGAAVEGGSELLAMPSWLKKMLNGGAKDIVSAGAEEVAHSYGKVGLNFLKDILKEGSQEAIVDPVMNETGNLLNGTNDSLMEGTGQDFLGGALMSVMLGSLGLPAELHNVRAYKIAKNSMDTQTPPTPDEVKAMKEDLDHIGNVVEQGTVQPVAEAAVTQIQGIGQAEIGQDLGDSVEIQTPDGQVFNIRKAIFDNAEVQQVPQEVLPSEANIPSQEILPSQDFISKEESKASNDILQKEVNQDVKANLANAPKEESQDIKESSIKSVPISSINVNPEKFQFKGETNAEGVTNQFKGGESFKPEMAGVVTLWKDKNNKLWVVNGHHRLEFAKRSGVTHLNAQILNESDGYSAKDMRTLGAKINIADGKGSSIDSAKIFRENNMELSDLKKEGLSLSEGKVKNGYYLSKLNDRLFNKVISKEITENKAVIIGQEFAGDEASQNAVMDLLNTYSKKGKTISDDVFREVLASVKASEHSNVKQETLFGIESLTKSNTIERGEIISGVKKLLGSEKKLFENLTNAKKAELIKKAGNKLSDKKNVSSKELAELALNIVDGFKNSKGTPISDVFSKYAKLYAEKKITKQQAIEGAFKDIKALIKGGNYFVKDNGGNTKGSSNVPRARQNAEGNRQEKNGTTKESDPNAQSEEEAARNEVSAARRNDVSAKELGQDFETEHFRGTKYSWGLEVMSKRRGGGYINASNKAYPQVNTSDMNIPSLTTTFRNLDGGKINSKLVESWKETARNFYNLKPFEKEDLVKIINIYAAEQKAKEEINAGNDEMAAAEQPEKMSMSVYNYLSKIGEIQYSKSSIEGRFNIYVTDKMGGDLLDTNSSASEAYLEKTLGKEIAEKIINGAAEDTKVINSEDIKLPKLSDEEKAAHTKEIALKAVKEFGTTRDFREAGYLTTNGKLLDFSEKNDGGQAGTRNLDHHNFNIENNDMYDFMDMGNIRMKPESNGFEVTQMPTLEQERVLKQYIDRAKGEVYVDLGQVGKHNSSPVYMEYQEGTKAEKILRDIKGFYENGEVRKSIIQAFHEQAATIKENAETYGQPNLAPTFYSQLHKVVSEKLANRITPQELLKNLDSWQMKGLIKADEVKWSGIKDWLEDFVATGDNERLEKQNILDALKSSQIKIEEVEKNTEKVSKKMKEFGGNLTALNLQISEEQNKILNEILPPKIDTPELNREENQILEMLREITDEILGYGHLENSIPNFKAKYPNVNLEKLISLSYKKHRVNTEYYDFAAKQNDRKTRFDSYKVRGGENYTELLFTMPDKVDFNSAHWHEEGVIAHTRFTDRIDFEGKKVLFLEEIQSDLHQRGRKEGYRNQEEVDKLYKEYEVIKKEISDISDEIHSVRKERSKVDSELSKMMEKQQEILFGKAIKAATEEEAYNLRDMANSVDLYLLDNSTEYRNKSDEYEALTEKMNQLMEKQNEIIDRSDENYSKRAAATRGVSPAPFSKNWHEFVLKRMIRYAAENGYDKIAWATGEQNADHYDLRKFVSNIKYQNNNDGTYELVVNSTDGDVLLDKYNASLNEIEATLGQSIAKRIENAEGQESAGGRWTILQGDGLAFGGEGMQGFYNKIVPDFLNKYLKKWGAKVEDILIGGDLTWSGLSKDEIYSHYKKDGNDHHTMQQGVELTPSMRNDVLYNGQPLFEKGAAYGADNAAARKEINAAYEEMAANEQQPQEPERLDKEQILAEIKKYEDDIVNGNIPKELVLSVLNKVHELRNKLEKVQGTKERKHFETYQNSDAMNNETKLELAKKDTTYIPITNKETWEKALDYVYHNYDAAVSRIKALEGAFRNADDTAIAEAILFKMQQEKRFSEAAEWASEVAAKATSAGQAVQALAIWGKLSPEGILRSAATQFNKATTEGDKLRLKAKTKDIKDKIDKANIDTIDKIGSEIDRIIKKKGIKVDPSKVKPDEETNKGKTNPSENTKDETDQIIDRVMKKTPEEKLADKVSTHAQRSERAKLDNPMEDMIKTLYEVATEVLPEKEKPNPRNPIEFITKALNDKEQYKEVWKKAQEIVKERFNDNPEALAALDGYFKKYLDVPFSEKKMDKAIKMDLKDLDIDIRKLVRKHYLETDKVTKTLQQRLIDKGLSVEDSKFLADYIEKRMAKLTKIAKESILNKMIGKPKTKQQKNLYEKVVELSNLGALEDEKYRAYAASKMGIPVLTEEVAKDLVERANYIQTMKDGEDKQVQIFLMMDRIAAQIPPKLLEKINAAQSIFQLLNPKTWTRNVVGNSAFAKLDRYATYIPAKVTDLLVRGIARTGESTVSRPRPIVYTKGLYNGAKKGYRYAKIGMQTDFMEGNKLQLPRITYRKETEKGIAKMLQFHALEKALRISLQASDTAYKEATIAESLVQQMKLKKVSEPTQEMLDRANALADYRTFNNDSVLSSLFSGAKRLLNSPVYTATQGRKGHKYGWGVGDILIKYPKVPANLLNIGLDYSPVGVIKAAIKLRQSIKETGKVDQFGLSMAIGRAAAGTTLIYLAYFLAKLGLISGKGDKDKDLNDMQTETGFGQYRFNYDGFERYLMTGDAEQAKPQDGDRTINYDWLQPNGLSIAIGADMAASKKIIGGDTANSIIAAISSGANTLAEQPLLTAAKNLASSTDKIQGIANAVSGVPASFVPSVFNQVRQLTDNTPRDTVGEGFKDDVINKVKARLPMVSNTLPARANALGEIKKTYQNDSNNLWNVFINPSYINKVNITPEQRLVLDIYNETGSKIQVPRVVNNYITLHGEKVMLTPDEKLDYQQRVGEMAQYELSKIPAMSIDAEKQAAKIQNILTDINKKISDEILIEKGYNPKSKKKPSDY